MKQQTPINSKSTLRLLLVLLLTYQFSSAQLNITQLLGIDESALTQLGTHQLTPNTADAFCAMQTAAKQDGIDLQLVSAYRSFTRQQQIFEAKFMRYTSQGDTPKKAIQRILNYSTIPGTSRHHWGTDIDITDSNAPKQTQLLVAEKFHDNGPFERLHKWMQANAQHFGFYLVYTNDKTRTGFAYEPWHYSYLPEAEAFLQHYEPRTAFAYFKSVGVAGSEHIDRDFWDDYYTTFVKGINAKLIQE